MHLDEPLDVRYSWPRIKAFYFHTRQEQEMRRIMVLLILAMTSIMTFAQTESVKDILVKNEQALRDAAVKGDSLAIAKWYADDAVTISGATGQSTDKQNVVQRMKDGKVKYQSIDTSDIGVMIVSPDIAIAHGTAEVKGMADGHDFSGKYHYARTWVKRSGKWQVVWFQATKMLS